MNGRVLLLAGGEAASRTAVDWMAAHQSDCDVVVAPRGPGARPIGRAQYPPFRPAEGPMLNWATSVATVLAAPRGGEVSPACAAAAFAVASDMVLVVSGREVFADLVSLSAWSMNVPSRPSDAIMARHLAIAARAWARLALALSATSPAAAGAALVEPFLAGDGPRIEAACRARRRAARADGPVRFRRVAPKSAGLRPLVLYIDLLPALAAAGEPARALLRGQSPSPAADLLRLGLALFL